MPSSWYQTLAKSNEVRQGDLIPRCPIIIPPTNFTHTQEGNVQAGELTVKTIDSVVVSQSCDLEQDKIDIVLVCPYMTLTEFFGGLPLESDKTGKGRTKKLEQLRQGNLPSYHLMDHDPDDLPDFVVVDFRNVFGVNYSFLKSFVANIPTRKRLLPPYREHLSQSFARFFMRVGLPMDINDLM